MKKLTHLPIILLVFLCSCKSNSFMTQRYTKLGHASNNHHKEHTADIKRNTRVKPEAQTEVIQKSQEITLASSGAVAPNAKNSTKSKTFASPKRIIDPLLNAGNTMVNSIKQEAKKSEPQQVSTKKTFKERINHAAGVLNTLFKIVLFCIILAILVAVIIIIILT